MGGRCPIGPRAEAILIRQLPPRSLPTPAPIDPYVGAAAPYPRVRLYAQDPYTGATILSIPPPVMPPPALLQEIPLEPYLFGTLDAANRSGWQEMGMMRRRTGAVEASAAVAPPAQAAPPTAVERKIEKRHDLEKLFNSAIVFANGAIQICVITTALISAISSGGPIGIGAGVAFAVLVGGRISLYIVEIAEGVLKNIHKVQIKDEKTKAEVMHVEDTLDVVNRVLKGIIQTGQFVTAAVGNFLNSANSVARYITAPILSAVACAEVLILSEEISLNMYEAFASSADSRLPAFRIPYWVEKTNSLIRGIIQIIAVSSLAAAAWVATSQVTNIIGYIRAALAGLRVATLLAEIATIFLHEYWRLHPATA